MSNRIYVGNIPFTATEDELREAFAPCGEVSKIDIVMDRDTGRPRGFAFVEMTTENEARKAINELDGTDLGGRRLTVNEAKARSGGAPKSGGYRNGDQRPRSSRDQDW